MSLPVWKLEWTLIVRRRRLFALNVGIPLLLVLPIIVGGAPAFHAAAVYAVLFTLVGTFGSTIPLLREADGGPLRRVLLTGIAEPSLLAQRLLANTVLDAIQLLPAFFLIFGTGRAGAGLWMWAFAALGIALLFANLVGVWVAAIAGSLAEGALFAAVTTLFLLHGSGVFRTAPEGSPGALLEISLPFGPLHQAFLAGASGAQFENEIERLLLPGGIAAGALLITILLGGPLLERITVSSR